MAARLTSNHPPDEIHEIGSGIIGLWRGRRAMGVSVCRRGGLDSRNLSLQKEGETLSSIHLRRQAAHRLHRGNHPLGSAHSAAVVHCLSFCRLTTPVQPRQPRLAAR